MSRHSLVVGAALVVAFGWAACAGAQGDLDVTMRVLDDVTDVEAVILAIGNDAAEAGETGAAESAEREAPGPVAADGPTESGAADDLAPKREDDGEAALEDRDVVEEPVVADEPAAVL